MKLPAKIISILCEDIRKEVGNKVSLIGVYNRTVVLPKTPFVFSKLCLFIMIDDIKKEVPSLTVRFFVPGSDQPGILKTDPMPHDQASPQSVNMGIEITPFRVKETGNARFELVLNGQDRPFYVHEFNFVVE